MVQTSINRYIDNLQRQIADAAACVKQKDAFRRIDVSKTENEAESPSGFLFVSAVEVQSYKLIGSETAYTLLGHYDLADNSYAAGAYRYVVNAGRGASVVEGLIFENNRNFDFRV